MREVSEWYGTPVSSSTYAGSVPGRFPWRKLAEGGWKHGQKVVRKYLNDKAYAERIKRIKQGQDIEAQRLSQKKMGNSRNEAQKNLTTRSSMVVTGKLKLKRKKSVKVSKSLRAKVQKVLEGHEARGKYRVITPGFIGTQTFFNSNQMVSLNATAATGPLGANNMFALVPGTLRPPNRTFYNSLVEWQGGVVTTSALASAGWVEGGEFNFFTIGKILDAAAVLFNDKQPSCNPYNTTGNLSANTNNNSAQVPTNPGKLKINVLRSGVTFTMKNVSDRVVTVEIWELVPTLKFIDTAPLNLLASAETDFLTSSVLNGYLQYLQGAVTAADATGAFADPNFEWVSTFNQHGFKFRAKKRKMVMAPEETCVHTIKGPSGTLDVASLVVDSAVKNYFLKDWSVGCLISVIGDQVIRAASTSDGGGKFANVLTGVDATSPITMGAPVAIELDEFYSISVPEVAGFTNPGTPLNVPVELNLRRPVYKYWNRGQANNSGAYTVSNEVNPIADSTTNTLK